MAKMTEDEVRNIAGGILGFTIVTPDGKLVNVENKEYISGVGQDTTFIKLGKRLKCVDFKGVCDKPDGWYLPRDVSRSAIILEAKNEEESVYKVKWEIELLKNCDIALRRYKNVIGILYNGKDIRIFKNKVEELTLSANLQRKDYYLNLFTSMKIDKQHIYEVTQKINNDLHFKFGMQDLQDRMIFTACALVAQRYNPLNGLEKLKGMGYSIFHHWIQDALKNAIKNDKKQNNKLNVLLEEYSTVRMAITEDQEAIDRFIDNVCEIAELVNSEYWNGEDVMAIFFNEFNRYRGKADAGQIFTPDHVTSFMYRLIKIDATDRILDATCGSGAFLVKAMCNMIKEVGGIGTPEAEKIMAEQLYGIEMYRKVFALACANMMIHKDGKTNLAQLDAKSEEAADWIKRKNITKVLMNPPYERKYGCMKIIENVLKSVPKGTKCAFIMPDKKLEKDGGKKLLKNHTLQLIVKMPENLFQGVGVTTSIFVFEAGVPQKKQNIIGYYIEDDGLETVKNQGRQDIKNRWDAIEDYWITAIHDGNDYQYDTRQIINPLEHLSYQMPEKPFEVTEEDFVKTIMDYELYKIGSSTKELGENILQKVMYGSDVIQQEEGIAIILNGEKNE